MRTLTDHEQRITKVEGVADAVDDIGNIVSKIWRAIKWGAPTVLAYLVGSGWIGQDVAAGLKAALGL